MSTMATRGLDVVRLAAAAGPCLPHALAELGVVDRLRHGDDDVVNEAEAVWRDAAAVVARRAHEAKGVRWASPRLHHCPRRIDAQRRGGQCGTTR
jgi:hypothetical protein